MTIAGAGGGTTSTRCPGGRFPLPTYRTKRVQQRACRLGAALLKRWIVVERRHPNMAQVSTEAIPKRCRRPFHMAAVAVLRGLEGALQG